MFDENAISCIACLSDNSKLTADKSDLYWKYKKIKDYFGLTLSAASLYALFYDLRMPDLVNGLSGIFSS